MLIRFALIAAAGAALMLGADAKYGQEVYAKACKSCHGADGTPNPAVMKMMKVEMKHLGEIKDEAKWTEAILKGIGKMKPIKSVSEAQAGDIFAFGKTLKK
jgi:mono/diheme cytochrome c family protein